MERLGEPYETILNFIEQNPDKYQRHEIALKFKESLIQRLQSENYIMFPHSTGRCLLDIKGSIYLSTTRIEDEHKNSTEKENKKTRLIAIWAIAISGIGVLAQVLISLLRNN